MTNEFDELENAVRRDEQREKAHRQIEVAMASLVMGGDARSSFFAMLAFRIAGGKNAIGCFPDESVAICGKEITTAATDGHKLIYNPEFVAGLNKRETTGLLVHEIMHCANRHQSRMEARDPERWNAAADLAINSIIREAGFDLPPHGMFPGEGRFGHLPDGQSAEWYYSNLPADPGGDGDGGEGGGGDPGGCGGVLPAGDSAECARADAEWEIAVAQAEQIAQQKGDLPAGLQRIINEQVRPSAPWREILRRFVNSMAKSDYAWFPPNRRYIAQDLYLPSVRSEDLGTVVVAFDTSGSIGSPEMTQFANEIEAILASFQCKVRLLYHDHEVAGETEWSSTDGPIEIKPVGGGGTSHIPVFERVDEIAAEEQVTAVICLTDGYTLFPPVPSSIPTLWAINNDQVDPPWGETVRVDG